MRRSSGGSRWPHAGDWEALVADLLERHYDPAYTRAIVLHYPRLPQARRVTVAAPDEQSFVQAARELLEDSLETVA